MIYLDLDVLSFRFLNCEFLNKVIATFHLFKAFFLIKLFSKHSFLLIDLLSSSQNANLIG